MSLRQFVIRSNIAVHGLAFAVERERVAFIRRGCSADRAASLAILICTGRLVA